MTPNLIILQGGENVKIRNQRNLFMQLISNRNVSSILIIPWTTDSIEKENNYRGIYFSYFKELGFRTIEFVERDDNNADIEQKFMKAEVLYLPGGDPVILKEEIGKRSLQQKISDFGGIVIGNSAGAIVLANCGYAGGVLYRGFGIIDMNIEVHSNFGQYKVNEYCEPPIIGIPEEGWIVIRTSK